ncbi:MAG: hypothetical protein JWR00_3373, partial [Rubritepida sp.]|nr:hypothetical protein [Rubritepida sp.]
KKNIFGRVMQDEPAQPAPKAPTELVPVSDKEVADALA